MRVLLAGITIVLAGTMSRSNQEAVDSSPPTKVELGSIDGANDGENADSQAAEHTTSKAGWEEMGDSSKSHVADASGQHAAEPLVSWSKWQADFTDALKDVQPMIRGDKSASPEGEALRSSPRDVNGGVIHAELLQLKGNRPAPPHDEVGVSTNDHVAPPPPSEPHPDDVAQHSAAVDHAHSAPPPVATSDTVAVAADDHAAPPPPLGPPPPDAFADNGLPPLGAFGSSFGDDSIDSDAAGHIPKNHKTLFQLQEARIKKIKDAIGDNAEKAQEHEKIVGTLMTERKSTFEELAKEKILKASLLDARAKTGNAYHLGLQNLGRAMKSAWGDQISSRISLASNLMTKCEELGSMYLRNVILSTETGVHVAKTTQLLDEKSDELRKYLDTTHTSIDEAVLEAHDAEVEVKKLKDAYKYLEVPKTDSAGIVTLGDWTISPEEIDGTTLTPSESASLNEIQEHVNAVTHQFDMDYEKLRAKP